MDSREFPLKRGGEIHLRAVSQYDVIDILRVSREAFEEEHGEVRCPTFELPLGGGELGSAGSQRVQYTVDNIQGAPSDDVTAWRTYQTLKTLWQHESFQVTARVLLSDGVVEDPPDNGEWQEKYIRRGIDIPEDPDARKVFWIERQVVLGPGELITLVSTIQALASAEVLAAADVAADTFRDPVESQPGSDSE